MKQNDSYQDFDKQVQQLLGQASEPVPEGAWEAIATRLAAGAGAAEGATAGTGATIEAKAAEAGAATRRAVILKWVRRTGFAVAGVAAAVLLAILLWNNPEQTSDDQLAVVTEQTSDDQLTVVTESSQDKTLVQNGESEPITVTPEQTQKEMFAQNVGLRQKSVASPVIAAEQGTEQSDVTSEEAEGLAETAQSVIVAQSVAAQSTEVPAQAEAQPAEAQVQPIDWDHLPDLEEEQAGKKLKHQPNGFHLAAYTNALSNFTNNKSGQYTGYSGVAGDKRPDHSYFDDENCESNYSIPLTFGLNVTYDILPRFSMGIGLNYTRLSRHFAGTYYQLQADGTFDAGTDYDNIYNIQQFIGVPITAYFHIVRTKRINFYVYANGTVEKCLANTWTANNRTVNYNEPVKGVQFNAGAGLGVDFMLAPVVSIYLDPNVKYYFGLNQPKSIRTKQPFMFGFEAGVRFHL